MRTCKPSLYRDVRLHQGDTLQCLVDVYNPVHLDLSHSELGSKIYKQHDSDHCPYLGSQLLQSG